LTDEPPDANCPRAVEIARRRAIDAVHARLEEVRRLVVGRVNVRTPLADEPGRETGSEPANP
jgi:hypothetical protein